MQKKTTLPATTSDTFFNGLTQLQSNAEVFRQTLEKYDDDQLNVIFHGLEEATSVAWMLQADIIANLHARGRYGDNVIKGIAQFLKVPERRIYELYQIHKEILSQSPELRSLPLEKSHFVNALRAKKYGQDPVHVLEEAADNLLGANAMRRKIEAKPRVTDTTFYELTKSRPDCKQEDLKQTLYLSPSARIVEYDGISYLEVFGKEISQN